MSPRPATSSATSAASSPTGVTATPWTTIGGPAVRRPTSSPACVPPVADGSDQVVERDPRAAAPVGELETGDHLADRAGEARRHRSR